MGEESGWVTGGACRPRSLGRKNALTRPVPHSSTTFLPGLPSDWRTVGGSMRHAVVVLFTLSCFAYTQDSTTNFKPAPSTREQVLYVADASNLYTYNIDPQTFQPSLMGTQAEAGIQLNEVTASSECALLF